MGRRFHRPGTTGKYTGGTRVLFHGGTPTTRLSRRGVSRKMPIQVHFRSRSCTRGPVEAWLNSHGALGFRSRRSIYLDSNLILDFSTSVIPPARGSFG
jgi:hypothetical protein